MNIIGRVTADAQVRSLSNEKQVVNFSVATNDGYRNKQGEYIEQTTFFDCAYFISPNIGKILLKGALVELAGRVSARAWMDKQGEPKAGLSFTASQIKLHAKPASRQQDIDGIEVHQPVLVTPQEAGKTQGSEHDDFPF